MARRFMTAVRESSAQLQAAHPKPRRASQTMAVAEGVNLSPSGSSKEDTWLVPAVGGGPAPLAVLGGKVLAPAAKHVISQQPARTSSTIATLHMHTMAGLRFKHCFLDVEVEVDIEMSATAAGELDLGMIKVRPRETVFLAPHGSWPLPPGASTVFRRALFRAQMRRPLGQEAEQRSLMVCDIKGRIMHATHKLAGHLGTTVTKLQVSVWAEPHTVAHCCAAAPTLGADRLTVAEQAGNMAHAIDALLPAPFVRQHGPVSSETAWVRVRSSQGTLLSRTSVPLCPAVDARQAWRCDAHVELPLGPHCLPQHCRPGRTRAQAFPPAHDAQGAVLWLWSSAPSVDRKHEQAGVGSRAPVTAHARCLRRRRRAVTCTTWWCWRSARRSRYGWSLPATQVGLPSCSEAVRSSVRV